MRNLQNNISNIVGNVIVRRVSKLTVGAEVLRSLCADLSTALSSYALDLYLEISGALRHWPSDVRGTKPRVHTVRCFAMATQRQWGREITCRPAGA